MIACIDFCMHVHAWNRSSDVYSIRCAYIVNYLTTYYKSGGFLSITDCLVFIMVTWNDRICLCNDARACSLASRIGRGGYSKEGLLCTNLPPLIFLHL